MPIYYGRGLISPPIEFPYFRSASPGESPGVSHGKSKITFAPREQPGGQVCLVARWKSGKRLPLECRRSRAPGFSLDLSRSGTVSKFEAGRG